MMFYANLSRNLSSGSEEEVENVKSLQTDGQTDEQTDRRTEGQQTSGDQKSSHEPLLQVS